MNANQWREILPPQRPVVPEMRLDGPGDGYVTVGPATMIDGPPVWHLWVSLHAGCFRPRVDGEPHPLGATLDHAIEHCERMLAWLRERRAELPEAPTPTKE